MKHILPKISVITVCYNSHDSIENTILSIINQDYPNLEYIIVDGLSNDGTIDIIKKYSDKISKFISDRDQGIYDAMNKGIDLATGDWINFMNSGDSFVNNLILSKVFVQSSNLYDVVFGDCILNDKGELNYFHTTPFYLNKKNLGINICHQSIFVKTELIKTNKFNLLYKICADYEMIYKLHKQGFSFLQLEFPICIYQTGGGISSTFESQIKVLYENTKIESNFLSLKFYRNLLKLLLKIISKRINKKLFGN